MELIKMNNSTLYNELIKELTENAISFIENQEDQNNINYINIPVINLKIYDRIENLKVNYNDEISYVTDPEEIEGIITSSNYYELMQDSNNWYL